MSVVLLCFGLLSLGAKSGLAATDAKIAVLPFSIYSKGNIALLQEAVYDSLVKELRKTKEIEIIDKNVIRNLVKQTSPTEAVALSAGKAAGASHVIWGSLTEFGDRINVDVRVLDVATGKASAPLTAQGKGMDGLSAVTAKLKGDIIVRISAKQRISKVLFKGNQKIESIVIHQAIKSAPNAPFSETQLTADIKSIYKLSYFEDVLADVTDSPEGKVITFIVTEKGLITDITIRGNKIIDRSDIESALTFKKKQILNQEKITSSVEKVKALYDGKGYYNAEITYRIEKVGEKDQRVVFEIKENEKLYIKKISFEGNRSFTDKDLKTAMKTAEKDFFYWVTDAGALKKDQLKQDINKLNAFYLNNGFIQAHVGDPAITYEKKGIYIKIPIVEGKRFKVGKVDISGESLKVTKAQLLAGLTISKKEFFDRGAIIKDIEYLTGACNDEGYAYADISPKTQANDKEQTVNVTYDISLANIVYFNRISITGNTKTRDKVIRRMLSISEGEMYNGSRLKQSYRNLERLRYFEEVDFQTERASESQTDVNIRIKEKSTGMFSVGAGYSALDGAMLMASITQQNLFGRGQTLSVRATIAQVSNYYNVSFVEPWLFDTPLWSKLDLWNMKRYYTTYTLQTTGIGATLGYPVWEKIYAYVQYTYSISDIFDIDTTSASSYVQAQAGKYTTSAITPTLTRDTRDDNFFPKKGSVNSIFVTHAGTPPGRRLELRQIRRKNGMVFRPAYGHGFRH